MGVVSLFEAAVLGLFQDEHQRENAQSCGRRLHSPDEYGTNSCIEGVGSLPFFSPRVHLRPRTLHQSLKGPKRPPYPGSAKLCSISGCRMCRVRKYFEDRPKPSYGFVNKGLVRKDSGVAAL